MGGRRREVVLAGRRTMAEEGLVERKGEKGVETRQDRGESTE